MSTTVGDTKFADYDKARSAVNRFVLDKSNMPADVGQAYTYAIQKEENWVKSNPGKPVPDAVREGFAREAMTKFVVKSRGFYSGETSTVVRGYQLPTEKQRVSYMIGLDIAKTLEPIKGELDVDTVAKAIGTTFAGGKPLLNDAQNMAVREAFGKKMQAKQLVDQQATAGKNQQEGDAFLAANGKKPEVKTTASGLQYQVVREGTGPKPKADDMVKVNYVGTTLDGKKFDSSYDRGQPAEFKLNQVVPGWMEGVQLMGVGSKYVLWVPGKLAYGERGTPGGPIGPNATLKFEVELLSINGK